MPTTSAARRCVVHLRFLATVALLPSAATAQSAPACPGPGLLVVAHGAGTAWNDRVREVVSLVEWDGPVELAFLMGPAAGDASWSAGLARLAARGARCAVAVPLMVSSHGAHVRQMRHYAGELAELPAGLRGMAHGGHGVATNAIPVTVTEALDGAPEVGRILVDRLAAHPDIVADRALVLVAHGPGEVADVEPWLAGLGRAIAPLRAAYPGRPVHLGLLRDDADPPVRQAAVAALRTMITALADSTADSVVVLTVLVSSGEIDQVRVPADLDGMPMRYLGSVLAPHPALARWIERVGREARTR